MGITSPRAGRGPHGTRATSLGPSCGQCGQGFPSCDFPMAAGGACTDPSWMKSKEFFFVVFVCLRADHQTTSVEPEPSGTKTRPGIFFCSFSFSLSFPSVHQLGAKLANASPPAPLLPAEPSASPQQCPYPGQPSASPTLTAPRR